MKKYFLAASVLAALPLSAFAAEVSNTYVEAGYQYVDGDYYTPDGGYLRGSFAINDSFYILGSYTTLSDKQGNPEYNYKTDSDRYSLGVGYQIPVSQNWYFNTELAYASIHSTYESKDDRFGDYRSSDTYGSTFANVGFRGLTSERTEIWVKAQYADISGADGEFSGLLGGQFKFTPRWSLVGEVGITDANDFSDSSVVPTYNVGIRASF